MQENTPYSVPAIDAAAKILNFLKSHPHSQKSLAEMCRDLGIPRSSGFHIMRTLEKHSLVGFDSESKRYRLGWALIELGARATEQMDFVEAVRPFLRALARETNLNCVIAQRRGDQIVIVDKVESKSDISVRITLGQPNPLASGALGKALMAFQGEEDIHSYFTHHGLPAHNQYSISDLDDWMRELAKVREIGYAKSLGEFAIGVNTVAAPIFDRSGGVNLTLAAGDLGGNLPVENLDRVGIIVRALAQKATAALGGTWRAP